MFGRPLAREDHDAPSPTRGLGHSLRPLALGRRVGLGDVVDPTGRLLADHGQGDGRSHVLHVSLRPAPLREVVGEEEGRARVFDALEEREEAVQRIAGSVDHGQAEHGSGQLRVAEHGLLDGDLVVFVVEPAEDRP
jgi:hypothetical protein